MEQEQAEQVSKTPTSGEPEKTEEPKEQPKIEKEASPSKTKQQDKSEDDAPETKPQKQGKPEEDVWGMRDYSLSQSVRIVDNNPNMPSTHVYSCSCGELIDRRTDWHLMITNGTLICAFCARCSSCRRHNSSASRRIVCIDGLALCHNCLEKFGYRIQPAYRLQIVDPNGLLEVSPLENASNADVLQEYKRNNRSQYKTRNDQRRPLRNVYYDPPSSRLPDDRNPLLTARPYDAMQGSLEKMTCPACGKVARGAERYVVPAAGRVYHKACFTCQSCKEPMNEGIQVAGRHFEFCTCEPIQAWCTRSICKKARLQHHTENQCWLGALRPGGRQQLDTDLSSQIARKEAAASEKQNESAGKE